MSGETRGSATGETHGSATDLSDLRWLLSMPVSRAMLMPLGVMCLRHLVIVHRPELCGRQGNTARQATRLALALDTALGPLEDVARLQADGVAMPDREGWALSRAEAARAPLAALLGYGDPRYFHGAQQDAHGFPFYPSPPVLLTNRKRKPEGSDGGGAPLGAA